MLIEDADERDLDDLVRIYNHAILTTTATFDIEPFTVDQRRPWFERFSADDPLLVCRVSGRVAGYACYLPYRPKPAYARTKEVAVYVDAACQARGIGSALYTALIARAQRNGVHVLLAVLAGDNPASEGLHRKFGFGPVGRLREVGHKFGRWIDTTFWEKVL